MCGRPMPPSGHAEQAQHRGGGRRRDHDQYERRPAPGEQQAHEHPGGPGVELEPGDYATFPGDTPHRYEALAPGTFAVLVMEHP